MQPTEEELKRAFRVGFQSIDDGNSFLGANLTKDGTKERDSPFSEICLTPTNIGCSYLSLSLLITSMVLTATLNLSLTHPLPV